MGRICFTIDMNSTRNVGQAFTWGVMGGEAIQAIQDLRWMIAFCIVLIIADFRFGRAESKKRHKEAVVAGNATLAKMTEFHMSRAIRRTCNKFIDYMTLLLVFCILGYAVTEPYGLCDHVVTAGIAMIIAFACEVCSIAGHFLYLKDVHKPDVSWKSAFVFLGRFAAGFARTKDEDLGNALDETIEQTLRESEKKKEDEG